MTAVRRGFNDLAYHYEEATVALDASGNGTLAITFDVAYANIPVGVVVPLLGGAGTWTLASLTTTGFTLTCTGATDTASQNVRVLWFTHQKL